MNNRFRYPNPNAGAIFRGNSPNYDARFYPAPEPSGQEASKVILTLDFKVPGANPKEGDGRAEHPVAFPVGIPFQCLELFTEKVIYHGSDWLEIDQILVDGMESLPSKIFTGSLKDGRMNDMRWRIMWDYTRCSTVFVVRNPREREGHFKLSMCGKYQPVVQRY